MKIKVATWNVNSIRSRIVNLVDWIKISNPDIILLQELKCLTDQFPYIDLEGLGYNIEVLGQKAYNGVAILSKFRIDEVAKTLPLYNIEKIPDNDSRYLEVLLNINKTVVKIASAYIPNGTDLNPGNTIPLDKTEKFFHKLRFYERIRERFKEALKKDEYFIMGGDFNTCPELIDMYSIKKDGDICCHKDERTKIREILNLGIHDVLRDFHKENDIFSWWRYRSFGWEKNQGLRLDLILATPNLIDKITSCDIESKETRGKERPSDHAPVVCEIEL